MFITFALTLSELAYFLQMNVKHQWAMKTGKDSIHMHLSPPFRL